MKTLILLVIVSVVALASANSRWQLNPEEQRDAATSFSFKVALKPQNMETLESLFYQVSNPNNPLYGKYLTHEQIADIISLPQEEINKVQDYLQSALETHCAVETKLSVHRDYIFVDTCAGQAEAIFPNLSLAVYSRQESAKTILRSSALVDLESNLVLLGVPYHLHNLIQGVHDVTDLPVTVTKLPTSVPFWLTTDKELNVNEISETFGIDYSIFEDSALMADDSQVRAGVISFENPTFSKSDLANYQKKFNIPANPIQKVIPVQPLGSQDGPELTLDIDMLSTIAQKVQIWNFVYGSNFDFIPVLDAVASTEGAPKLFSISYAEPETIFGESKVKANNAAFLKMSLTGITFISGAGDSGAVLNPNNCKTFDAEFPATSPYVTSVGGTAIEKSSGVEKAWINGGGGFSLYNTRPSYQDDHVDSYLKTATLPSNANSATYNTSNRAYPDVAAFAAFYPMEYMGYMSPSGGTSGATPQFAAVMALINVYRYQKGLPPLGPLNQALYQLPNVGFDVTVGKTYAHSRYGCDQIYAVGFEPTEGWDAVTGLGSPKFDVLLDAFTKA